MKNITLKRSLFALLAFMVLGIAGWGFTGSRGLDRYEIYLNNKLILKQAVNAPLSLRKLQLNDADKSGILRVFYIHCTNKGTGTDRSISVKDDKGEELKKWAFKDDNDAMEIPVKELLQVEKQNGDKALSLHYVAQELYEKDMMLAAVRFK